MIPQASTPSWMVTSSGQVTVAALENGARKAIWAATSNHLKDLAGVTAVRFGVDMGQIICTYKYSGNGHHSAGWNVFLASRMNSNNRRQSSVVDKMQCKLSVLGIYLFLCWAVF